MCVCVCVGGANYEYFRVFPHKHPWVWNPLLPQINITEQCESLCKRQINFENPPEPTLGVDTATE